MRDEPACAVWRSATSVIEDTNADWGKKMTFVSLITVMVELCFCSKFSFCIYGVGVDPTEIELCVGVTQTGTTA